MMDKVRSTKVLPLGEVLRGHFSQTNESQTSFSEKAKLSKSLISRLASGERISIRLSTAEKLAKALGAPIEDILESIKITRSKIHHKLDYNDEIPKAVRDFMRSERERNSNIYCNLKSDSLYISEHILREVLKDQREDNETRRIWIAPLGIFLTTTIALTTTTTHDFFIEAATWKAIFIICAIGSLCWLINTLRKTLKSKSLEHYIEKIKKESTLYIESSTPAMESQENSLSELLDILKIYMHKKTDKK